MTTSAYVPITPTQQQITSLSCSSQSASDSSLWTNPLTPAYNDYTALNQQVLTTLPSPFTQICPNFNTSRPVMTTNLQTQLTDAVNFMYSSVSSLQSFAASQVSQLSRTLSAALTLQLGPGNNGTASPPCNLLDPLIQLLSGIGQNFINAASNLLREVISMLDNIANCVLGIIGNIENLVANLYNQMMQLANDVTSLVNRVQNSINSLFQALEDFNVASNILSFLNGIPCIGQLISSSGTPGFQAATGIGSASP